MPNSAMLTDEELEAAIRLSRNIVTKACMHASEETQALLSANLVHYIIRRMEKEKNG